MGNPAWSYDGIIAVGIENLMDALLPLETARIGAELSNEVNV